MGDPIIDSKDLTQKFREEFTIVEGCKGINDGKFSGYRANFAMRSGDSVDSPGDDVPKLREYKFIAKIVGVHSIIYSVNEIGPCNDLVRKTTYRVHVSE
jgi:hypothetical protein